MSDDPGSVEPPHGQFEPTVSHFNEAELSRVMRQAMFEDDQDWASAITDKHGKPLPRLNVDDPRSATDDPLLRVGYALLTKLPEHWEFAVLNVTAAAEEIRTLVVLRAQRGDAPSFKNLLYLPEVAEACSALRRSMYKADGRGAWYNALIRLERDGKIAPFYDFDHPPFGHWGPNEVDLVLRDQELYPRDPERLPAWHPAR